MALVKSYHQLIALRLLVGALESCFAPGVLLLFSSWYKKNEQSKRFAVYISAAVLSGAFGGILAGAITGGLDGVYGQVKTIYFTEYGTDDLQNVRVEMVIHCGRGSNCREFRQVSIESTGSLTFSRAGPSLRILFCLTFRQIRRSSPPRSLH